MPPRAVQITYSHLIRRSIDLRLLYRHAARECEPGLRLVFAENAHTLDQLIGELQDQLREFGGNPPSHGSSHGVIKRYFSSGLIRVAERRDSAWIRALAHREQALLHAFEGSFAKLPTESALPLRKQLPRLHGIHMDMHNLGGAPRY